MYFLILHLGFETLVCTNQGGPIAEEKTEKFHLYIYQQKESILYIHVTPLNHTLKKFTFQKPVEITI